MEDESPGWDSITNAFSSAYPAWLMMLGAGVYALLGVWRAYREY